MKKKLAFYLAASTLAVCLLACGKLFSNVSTFEENKSSGKDILEERVSPNEGTTEALDMVSKSSQEFNVLDFGAIPNDNKDDTKAFRDCIKAALKTSNPSIKVPIGRFDINDQLTIGFLDNNVELIGELKNGKTPEIYSTSKKHTIEVRGFLFNPSKGDFTMRNFTLVGNNLPFSLQHPLINKDAWTGAVVVLDKRNTFIQNVTVKNFYGQGIYVSTTAQENISLDSRFDNVEITNCKVLNVWGYNPAKDNYGDGIYVSDVKKAIIQNNLVSNDVSQTNQLGRAGIVIEFMASNVSLLNNTVEQGYDRPIHIEATFGGHLVSGNQFKGSDMGLIYVEGNLENYKPVEIKNNIFTNANLFKNIKVNKVFAANSFGDRALMFAITKNNNKGFLISVHDNQFIIDGNFDYNSNAILNLRSGNFQFSNNNFFTLNTRSNFTIFNYGKSKFGTNILKNVMIK